VIGVWRRLLVVVAIGLTMVAAAWSRAHDNHPAAQWGDRGIGWWRLNPFGRWQTKGGVRLDPLDVLLGFALTSLWPTIWAAFAITGLAFLYARYYEPRHSVVAPPWEPEGVRDSAVGALLAVAFWWILP
jgi:hypothetical protein